MLIEKPRCNFKNCKYCFDGNCFSANKYENCKVTDLHSEIAKLTVDLDNAKSEVAREIFAEIDDIIKSPHAVGFNLIAPLKEALKEYNEGIRKEKLYYINKLKKKYTEEK